MAEETPPIVELAEWFQTPPGQYVLAWERAQFDAAVADVFGYYAWQVGLADWNLLRANRMPFKGCVGTERRRRSMPRRQARVVLAQPEALPFESQSVDLLVCPMPLNAPPSRTMCCARSSGSWCPRAAW